MIYCVNFDEEIYYTKTTKGPISVKTESTTIALFLYTLSDSAFLCKTSWRYLVQFQRYGMDAKPCDVKQ